MKKKKYENCDWYLAFVLWSKCRLQIVYSRDKEQVVSWLNKLDQSTELPKPINGTGGIPPIPIRTLSDVGEIEGPTLKNIRKNFHNDIPHLRGTKIILTKLNF